VKWRAVADQPGPTKHVVANADESEPGTFKDRVLMEHDPFALIEALTVAGLATGATNGWIYVRGEYPVAVDRLRAAIAEARAADLLGTDVLGAGIVFDIDLRVGAGAYICGEETALFNSIEGFRGEPRQKPPFPTTHGLFGQPTAINNVETLVNVLDIVTDGVDVYRELGTTDSPGTRLFCLSGAVARPGLYEHAMGVTLRQVLAAAGGLVDQREMTATLLGGAAGVFVDATSLDVPLTFEDTRAAGITLGSGVVMAFDETHDLRDAVARIAEFFRHESCGQCVPCRVGTQRQHELLVRTNGSGSFDAELFDDLAAVMKDASICGLGHTAASAIGSAVRLGLLT
jgi:NADH-quinone oxidoreductase subunit F